MTKSSTDATITSDPLWLSDTWKGAYWKIFSMACFAGINGIVRYWSGGVDSTVDALPVNVLMFFQNIFGALFLLPLILKAGSQSIRTNHPWLHLLRILAAVAGVYLFYLSLKVMPIAESIALQFTAPIFTVLGAAIFLKEKIGMQQAIAILFSLCGAFIISRPDIPLRGGAHPIGLAALLPLSSALVLVVSKLLTRRLANEGATSTTLATYLLVFMAPASLLLALIEWKTPTIQHLPWLMLLGALAAGAHWSFARAYQLAEVTFLTPFGFSKFLLSMLVGYFAFAEFPTSISLWIGMLIIFGSIFLLGYKISLYSWANRLRSN